MFVILFRNILRPQKNFPVCAAQETSCATMCPKHCVLVYQSLNVAAVVVVAAAAAVVFVVAVDVVAANVDVVAAVDVAVVPRVENTLINLLSLCACLYCDRNSTKDSQLCPR